MANFRDYRQRLTSLKSRRNMLVGAFWILLILLISTIAVTYVTDGQTQQSAYGCLLYTSPSPRDLSTSRMPSSA